jgi:hypothetical protein
MRHPLQRLLEPWQLVMHQLARRLWSSPGVKEFLGIGDDGVEELVGQFGAFADEDNDDFHAVAGGLHTMHQRGTKEREGGEEGIGNGKRGRGANEERYGESERR